MVPARRRRDGVRAAAGVYGQHRRLPKLARCVGSGRASFLRELGFHAWAPVFIFPFALVQALIFTRTKSLTYIVCVHLLFDLVLFLVLIHAHNSAWIDIFIY